jgi:SAM-dependent methyltransferase
MSSSVRRHYDNQTRQTLEERQHDPTVHLRDGMNEAKKRIISQSVRLGDVVLDLGCGNGGDLQKMADCRASYYEGYDLSNSCVSEARKRSNSIQDMKTDIRQGDFTSRSFWKPLRSKSFHVVNCQLAFHYAWNKTEYARRMVSEIARVLKPGGYWIGSYVSSERLDKLVKHGQVMKTPVYTIDRTGKYKDEYVTTVGDRIRQCKEWVVDENKLAEWCKDEHLRMRLVPFESLVSKDTIRSLSRDEYDYLTMIHFFQVYRPLSRPEKRRRDENDHARVYHGADRLLACNDSERNRTDRTRTDYSRVHDKSHDGRHKRHKQMIRGPAHTVFVPTTPYKPQIPQTNQHSYNPEDRQIRNANFQTLQQQTPYIPIYPVSYPNLYHANPYGFFEGSYPNQTADLYPNSTKITLDDQVWNPVKTVEIKDEDTVGEIKDEDTGIVVKDPNPSHEQSYEQSYIHARSPMDVNRREEMQSWLEPDALLVQEDR